MRLREIVRGLLEAAEPCMTSGAYGDMGFFEWNLNEAALDRTGATENWFGLYGTGLAEAWLQDSDEEDLSGAMVSTLVDYVRKNLSFYTPIRFRLADSQLDLVQELVRLDFDRFSAQIEPQLAGRLLEGLGSAISLRGVYTVERGGPEWQALQITDSLYLVGPFLREIEKGHSAAGDEAMGREQVTSR